MQPNSLARAGLLALLMAIAVIAAWEIYLRSKGIGIAYDDGKELWSDKRARVYAPQDRATVFIGSSRNKYDLDIATWESLTNDKVVQLGIEGTSPLPVLDDLAADTNFHGKLMIDITEGLVFTTSPFVGSEAVTAIEHYKKRTPAERASFAINRQLESKLVFLDKHNFSINAMLDNIPLRNRPGVFALPTPFPMDFGRINFGRQNIMTKRFETDTLLQNRVKNIWMFFGQTDDSPPLTEKITDSLLNSIKLAVDRIKARGGKVIFVRTPSSGPDLEYEQKAYPRDRFWEKLLNITDCEGIHFADYAATNHFICPEWSHLKQSDAILYTRSLIETLQKEKGWVFPYKPVQ